MKCRNKIRSRFYVIAVLLAGAVWSNGALAECEVDDYHIQRQKMVTQQIVARGVSDPAVLSAMKTVPRHCFVPRSQQHQAYRDGPLPIGHGQTISQPFIVARMSELLKLAPGQRVLEVGTGSGYQAAVLAHMGIAVYTIEIVEPLGQRAQKLLRSLRYGRIDTKIGDGYKGWPQHAPFDGIIVTCAPTHIPEPLKAQLAEGGRMVIPVGETHGVQQLFLLRKIEGRIEREKIFDVRFVPMKDEKGKNY